MKTKNYHSVTGRLLGPEGNSTYNRRLLTWKKVFIREIILQVKAVEYWETIKEQKSHMAQQANTWENIKQPRHPYRVRDKVLVFNKKSDLRAKILAPTQGPFKVIEVFGNGTLKLEKWCTKKNQPPTSQTLLHL